MRALLICVLLGVCAAADADTPPAVKEQLRKLSRLPSVSLKLAFGVNSMEGLLLADEDADPEVEIAKLRKAMTGTSEDAQRWLELGRLLWRVEPGSPAAKEALDKSVELFRKRVEAQPGNGQVLAQLGEALHAVDREDEAEKVLRDAVQADPKAWQSWVSLAGQLQAKANRLVRNPGTSRTNQTGSLEAGPVIKPSAGQIEQGQKLMAEAVACYDKAVAAAPNEPKVYERRGAGLCDAALFGALVRYAKGEEKDTSKVAAAFLDPQGKADFRKAVELNPRNYRAIGAGIMLEVMAGNAKSGGASVGGDNAWEAMPEESKTVVREGMTRLQKLGDDPDKKVAAGALELEGTLRFLILQDLTRSEEGLRRSIALDPSREKCWEMLTALLAVSGQSQEFADLCEQRVKIKDNAANRFMLAKAREKLGQFDRAEKELQVALKASPEDINALGGMAALQLKHTDTDSLRQAAVHLKRAEDLAAKQPPEKQRVDQNMDLFFTHALYNGVIGESESARKLLREILDHNKDYEGAQTAMEALGRQ